VFTGTFTTAGLATTISNGGLTVEKEGNVRKFVKQVDQITYPVREGVIERGQTALLVTERAVFRVEAAGLALVEIADGINLRRDVLDQMEFAPSRIAEPLPKMDAALFAV